MAGFNCLGRQGRSSGPQAGAPFRDWGPPLMAGAAPTDRLPTGWVRKLRAAATPRRVTSGVLLVLRRPHPLLQGVLLAHVGALFGAPVIFAAAEVIDFGLQICPDDSVRRAPSLGLGLGRELVSAARR